MLAKESVLFYCKGIFQNLHWRQKRRDLNNAIFQLRHAQGLASADENRPVALRRVRSRLPARNGPRELYSRAHPNTAATSRAREDILLVLCLHRCPQVLLFSRST